MADPIVQPQAPQQEASVNVFNPEGDLVSIPQSQAQEALNMGYAQASPEDVAHYAKEQKYGTLPQQAITAAEKAGSAATFGISTGVERAVGVPGKDIRAREEVNPGAALAGTTAGLVVPALIAPEVSAANLMEHAGASGAKALGLAGEGAVSKIGSTAAKMAIENSIFQGGDEVSKMFAGDPNQTVGTAMTDIGLSSLIGGGLGAGFGAVSPLWNATLGKQGGEFLNLLKNRVNGNPIEIPSSVETAIADTGAIPPTTVRAGMSSSPEVAKQFGILRETGTTPGITVREDLNDYKKSLEDGIVESLGKRVEDIPAPGSISHNEVGTQIQDKLAGAIKDRFEPISKEFNGIRDQFSKIDVKGDIASLGDKLGELSAKEGWNIPSLPQSKLVNETLKDLPHIYSLEDLRKYQSNLWAKAGNDPGLYNAAGKIVGVLRGAETEALERAAEGKGPENLLKLQAARTAYGQERDLIETLNDRLHVGKYGGPDSFIDALKEMKPEDVLNRLSKPNDAGLLDLLQNQFPDIVKDLRDYQVNKVLMNSAQKAGDGHSINTKNFFSAYEKMSPEMRKFAFPEGSEAKLGSFKNILDALPEHKSSFTARHTDNLWSLLPGGATAMASMLLGHNPIVGFVLGQAAKWVSRDAPDAIRMAFLKFLGSSGDVEPEAFKTMVDFIHHTIQGESLINKAAVNIFKTGVKVIPDSKLPDDRSRKKLDKQLKELQEDPGPLFNTGGKASHYLANEGTAMSQIAANSVNYLNSLRPNESKQSPLDSKPVVNQAAKSAFNRALDIAEQPLIVLQSVKEGTVTPSDMQTLHALYPGLYDRLSQKMISEMMNHLSKDNDVPYKTRIGISLFMGQPLDSTMTPQSIQSIQGSFMAAPAPQSQEQAPQQGQRQKHSMAALSKMPQQLATPQQARQLSKLTPA